jgi:restriction system protein
MSLWLFRAGKSGEHETKFLDDGRVYLTWEGLTQNLATIPDKKALYELLNNTFPNNKIARIRNWGGQIWPIANEMKVGDWIALPSKTDSVIHFGEITGDYVNTPQNQSPYYHYRNVNWFARAVPRKVFDQDILNSLGALPTICRIKRNDAENRVRELAQNNWNLPEKTINQTITQAVSETPAQQITQTPASLQTPSFNNNATDFAQLGKAQITDFITQNFANEKLTILVDAILKAQGYSTIVSSIPKKEGVDILASSDKTNNKLCVQIHNDELNRLSLYQIMGAMQNFNAQKGLLVTWREVTIQVSDEIPNQAFNLEIWDKDTLVNKLMSSYNSLSDEIKAQIPLKRSWSLSLVS